MSIGANAAAAIILDLRGRCGFDGVWGSTDEDTVKEIEETWARIIDTAILQYRPPEVPDVDTVPTWVGSGDGVEG